MEINKKHPTNIYAMELGSFFRALYRRKISIILIASSVLALCIAASYLLPTIYKTSAIVVIEKQEIPVGIVESTITGYLQERIELVKREAFTEENLWNIAEAHDLYAEYRNEMPRELLANLIRGNIITETEYIDAIGAKGLVQIGSKMSITYEAETPGQAQSVSNALVELFLETNNQMRLETSSEVITFLKEQADSLENEISELESKLAVFKQEQHQQLPELMDVNLKVLEKTENEIVRSEVNIRSLEDNIASIEAELSLTKPYQDIVNDDGTRLMSANERLSVLTAEFLRASARYSQKHPDIIRLKREINALGGEGADISAVKDLIGRLTLLKENLLEAKQKYSDTHPDVLKLKQSILSVEKGLRNATVSAPRSTINAPPDNPRYVTLQAQLNSARNNLSAERAGLEKLREKYNEYESRLFQTPSVEREYLTISRDYENTIVKYREIKDELREAQFGARLEAESRGDKMKLYQLAPYKSSPDSPNRFAFLVIGIFLGLISGVGYAVVAEYFDGTVHGSADVAKIFDAPPLAIIPKFQSAA